MFKQKLLDASLVALIVLCGAVFFHIAQASSAATGKLSLQELQSKSLIRELGEAKEQNELLNKKVQDSDVALQKLSSAIDALMPLTGGEPPFLPAPVLTLMAPSVQDSHDSEVPQTDTFNFLIVGAHHELADSLMVAAVNATTRHINLLSVPRDLSVNGRKINEYLVKFGPDVLREKVSEVIGQPIHHYAVFNMNAFEDMVDALGGVDIEVPRALYDRAYPDGKGGYIVYSVTAGMQHMNGVEALRYARSRHSTSDFDRAARQQLVAKAVQQQVLSFDFLNNLDQLRALYESLQSAIDTDISVVDMAVFLKNFQGFGINGGNVLSTENFLYSGYNTAGQYILSPTGNDYLDVQEFVVEVFNQ